MARRPRRPRQSFGTMTYDAMGNPTGIDDSMAGGSAGGTVYSDWTPTANPDIVKKVVATGTTGATADGAVSVAVDSPQGFDTWYKPTPAAYAGGRAQAALDTIQATATQIANAGQFAIANWMPLLIGGIALYAFLKYGGR